MMMMLPAEESMSNLTSAGSGEASVGSSQQQQPAKRKRCLPGNPDPEAEVVALSPKALMATNRFACEVCGKGFQRDQNLQLHRRGHNLPWKLKQRPPGKEVRKKVYVCPEITCVHHDPSRALGDLTGIKKHFSRKHGEKKWKCDKCSKKYAVQSDWKAHSKVCGTREYRCDCGTLFSRRDSFITHRAFCDALAEESARQMTGNSFISSHTLMFSPLPPPQPPIPPMLQMQFPHLMKMTATSEAVSDDEGGNNNNRNNSFIITAQAGLHEFKKETQQPPFNMRTDIPAWLSCPDTTSATTATTSSFNYLDFNAPLYASRIDQEFLQQEKEAAHHFIPAVTSTPHMSATALLQKAAQMGATMSLPTAIHSQMASHDQEILTLHGSTSQGPYLQDITVFDHMGRMEEGSNAGGSAAGNDGLTRDFLGLRAFSHRDLFSMAGFESCMSTASYEQQRKKSWQED